MTIEFKKHDTKSEQVSILKIINRYGTITRKQLVDLTGFSQAKISITINELKNNNLLTTIKGTESSGGRKANLLQMSGDKGQIIGVELGGYEIRVSLIDFSGKILSMHKRPSIADIGDPYKVMDLLMNFINGFLRDNKVEDTALKGIGIGISGIVNHKSGKCVYFRNKKSWENFPLKKAFEDKYALPCILDDSARMRAVAEKKYGACKGLNNFVVISIGVGVGAGIFINGNLFRSKNGYGGEIGHMVIKENGPRCVCGNYGCLESFVSGNAIEKQLAEALNDNVYTSLMDNELTTTKQIIEHAKEGDKLAYSIITDAAKHLGIGIANVINIFSPQLIVLAGGVSNAGELLLNPIEQVVRASALNYEGMNCQILLSQLNEYAAAHGAANQWITEILNHERAFDIIMS